MDPSEMQPIKQTSLNLSEAGIENQGAGDEPSLTIQNATGLLFHSLSLDQKSGVVFLDTGTSLNDPIHSKHSFDESSDDGGGTKREATRLDSVSDSLSEITHVSYRSWTGASMSYHDISKPSEFRTRPCEVLSASYSLATSSEIHFTPPSHYHLSKIIKKYPRGMLFSIEEEDIVASSSSGDETRSREAYSMPKTKDIIPTNTEISILRSHFPNSRQVIFVPFWDSSLSRYSALFAYNSSPY
jgi:hypothetical protein